MNAFEQKITMIIPIIKNDFCRMSWDFRIFFSCLPIHKIVFIGPAELEAEVREVASNKADKYDVSFLNENELIEYKRVQDFLKSQLTKWGYGIAENSRPGWYYQQYLKMEYSMICEDEYYLTWDADTIPLHRIDLFDADGIPYLDVKAEYCKDYFITIKRMLGLEKSHENSFISEHMLFSKKWMLELIEELDQTHYEGERYYEKIFAAMGADNIKRGFSEFETYGTWILNRHPSDYHIREWKSLRKGGVFFEIDKLTSEDRKWLGESFDAISFEKYHPYMMEWAELFQNQQFRQTMRADEIYEMVIKSGVFGKYENGMIRVGEDLWPV